MSVIRAILCALGLHYRVLDWSRQQGPYPLGWYRVEGESDDRVIDGWGPQMLVGMHCRDCDWRKDMRLLA